MFDIDVNQIGACGVIQTMGIAVVDRTVLVDTDEGEMVRFVEVDYPVLVAALGLVCGDRHAAEDAIQEALARAILAERRGRHIESLPAWVRVVAMNLLRNRWRSLRREIMASDGLRKATPIGEGDDQEIAWDLQRAIARLTRRQREAVALHYRVGLSVAETAASMRVSDGTVKTLLSRARIALAAELTDLGDSDG